MITIKALALVKHIGRSAQADSQPKPAKELAYPNARQTETLLQIGIEMTENKEHLAVASATRQVRQQWFSVGIFPFWPSFGLTGNRPQSTPASIFLRYKQGHKPLLSWK